MADLSGALGQGWDASEEGDWDGDRSPLPAGRYQVVAVESEWKDTKNNDGKYLQVAFEVQAPEQHAGRKLFTRLNLMNKSSKAVEIARAEFAALCKATGVVAPSDSEELHGIQIVVETKLEKMKPQSPDDEPRFGSSIVKYLPPNTPLTGQGQQKPNAPKPTTAGAGGKAPWQRG